MNINHFVFSAQITFIATMALGFFVLLKGRWRVSHYFFFSSYCFAVGLWCLFVSFFRPEFSDPQLVFSRFLHFFAILIPFLFISFVESFLRKQYRYKKYVVVIAAFLLFFNFFTSLLLTGVTHKEAFSFPTPGVLYPLFLIYFILVTSWGIVALFFEYKRSVSSQKNQLLYLIILSVLGYIGGMKNFLILFNLYPFPIYPYGTYAIPVYVIGVFYAIIKYRLMDIRVAISTAGIFLVVYSVALGIPFILYNKGYYFIALCSAILFATPAPFIYGYFRKQAEEKILREERERQDVITRVSHTFADILNVDEIIRSVVEIIGRTFHPVSVVFYIFNGEDYQRKEVFGCLQGYPVSFAVDHPLLLDIRKFGVRHLDELRQGVVRSDDGAKTTRLIESLSDLPAVVAIPFRRIDSMPGILLLGEKSGRSSYSDRDIAVLNDVAINGAMAIVNAQNYEQERRSFEEKMHDRRLKDIGLLGSAVAHQMANRLNRITAELWIAQDLLNENALQNDSRDELVSKIRECFQNYPLIIRDALSSRSIADALKRSSKKSAEPRVVGLRDLIQGGRALAEVKHPGIKIEFIEEYDEGIQLWVNDAVIQDVFANAFDNSLDAIRLRKKSEGQPPEYMGRIIVRAQIRADRVWIELEDNGIGIRPENMEKVFIPLFTTKGTENGTGLGLYAMQNLVKGQGGEIALTSEYGQWTRVCLQLPGVSSAC